MKSLLLIAATVLVGFSAQAQNFEPNGFGHDNFPGGFDRPGRPDFGRPDFGRPDFGRPDFGRPGRPGGGRFQEVTIECSSNDHRTEYCSAGGPIRDARLVRQKSKASCVEGQTWGYDRGSLWVAKGCRGQFRVTIGGGHGGGGHGGGHGGGWGDRSDVIRCESRDYKYANCRADGRIARVEIERQRSNSACIEGQSYGYDRDSIWVDKGCAADFRVDYGRF